MIYVNKICFNQTELKANKMFGDKDLSRDSKENSREWHSWNIKPHKYWDIHII